MVNELKASDEELMKQLRDGQQAGLDGLFRRHYQGLCLVSIRIVNQEESAEDIVQEFFLSLWKKKRVLPEMDSVGAYLRRSVRNRSLNYLRDQKRVPSSDPAEMPLIPTVDNLTEQRLEMDELRARVDRAVNALPARCRLIFVMSRFEDMKQKEIAEKLKISPKTVENQMGRAYRFLRDYLSAILLLGWQLYS